jgi:hypothetical protein
MEWGNHSGRSQAQSQSLSFSATIPFTLLICFSELVTAFRERAVSFPFSLASPDPSSIISECI